MKIVAFLNPKTGVGCTSLVYHLAWMYSELGYRVVAVDADPQADLSGMFLGFDQAPWLRFAEDRATGLASLDAALLHGVTREGRDATQVITHNLDFVASSGLFLEHFIDESGAQSLRASEREQELPASLARLRRLLIKLAKIREADLVLVDAGAGIGAGACLATVSADSLVIPTSPDDPSEAGVLELLHQHESWTSRWRDFVTTATTATSAADLPLDALSANDRHWLGDGPSLLGYVLTGEAHYASFILASPPSQVEQHRRRIEELAVSEAPLRHLGTLRRHPSLRELSFRARKPMFGLTAADGALGSIAVAVQRCRIEYAELARLIATRLGLRIPE